MSVECTPGWYGINEDEADRLEMEQEALCSGIISDLKVPVDYNLHLQRTSKAELFSNQYLHQAPKLLLIVINTFFLFLIK